MKTTQQKSVARIRKRTKRGKGDGEEKEGKNMDKKEFEISARTLLKYGIGKNIKEEREKLRALIKARRISVKEKNFQVRRL